MSTFSTSAADRSTTVARSPSNSTIRAASSASGTSGALPFLTSPTVPRSSPEAIAGEPLLASARRCPPAGSPGRRPRSTGTATARARSRAPPSGSPARRCRGPGPRTPRRRRCRATELAHLVPDRRRRTRRPRPARAASRPCSEPRGTRLRGALDRALVVCEVEVHTQLWQAEHALGDDVLEDLGGAALDRVRARAQEAVGPVASITGASGPRMSIASSVSDWLMSDHSHFPSDPSGPGWPVFMICVRPRRR